jgi:OmpA-OmpF porin, OOP family
VNKTKVFLSSLVFAGAISFSASVLAQASMQSLYVGGFAGQSKAKDGCTDLPAGLSCNDTDTAWKIFAGYQFHPNLAAEVGYVNLGETKASGVTSGVNVNATAKATAWELVGVGSWPVGNRLSLLGKLGAYYGTVDESATGSVPGFAATFTAKDSNTGFTFGFGGRFDITEHLAARAEWQRYSRMGGDNTGKSDVDVLGIALLWKF